MTNKQPKKKIEKTETKGAALQQLSWEQLEGVAGGTRGDNDDPLPPPAGPK